MSISARLLFWISAAEMQHVILVDLTADYFLSRSAATAASINDVR